MKKKVLFAAGAMIIAAAVSAAVCLTCGQTRHNDLFEQNLDALARGENENDQREIDCYNSGGNYNMASVCAETGFERATCKVSGEVSVFGITISGSFEKGKRYSIPWARYTCVSSPRNCCIKQGLYTGDTKLA